MKNVHTFTDFVNEGLLLEKTAKYVLQTAQKYASDADAPKAYIKDYLASIERMARKSPQLFVKMYGDFSRGDWEEDVRYNLANESLITEAKANLKDLAKDLAELDKGKGGMSWIDSIRVETEYDNKKGEEIPIVSVTGAAGDNTVKSYVNKLLKKLGFKPKFWTKKNLGDYHDYIWILTQFTEDDVDDIDWRDLEYDK